MYVVQSQLKICRVSENVGLPFDGVYLVVYSLNETAGDPVIRTVQ